MVFIRASLIAVGLTTIAAAASPELDRWFVEQANRTENTAGITVLAAAPRLYSYCGADILGGDIFTKRYPNPNDCVTNCLPSTGCNAGTWTRFEGGTCFFKRLTKGQTEYIQLAPNAGAVSFLRRDDTTPSELHYPVFNMDMPGNDLANVQVGERSIGIPRCGNLCFTNAKCNAYTWSPYNGGTCWLKTKSSPYVASTDSVSKIGEHDRNPAACLGIV